MRLRVWAIDWEYPAVRKVPAPEILDLTRKETLYALYLEVANGVVLELKIDADCPEALQVARGLLQGAGSARPCTLTEEQKSRLWLYESGYEVFVQGDDGYFFLYPVPVPERFSGP